MKKSQLSYMGVATIVAILVVVVFMITPVSASTCHPGFVTITPSSSWQFTQPSFSSIIVKSPAMNQGSAIQFSRPSFSSTSPDFIASGKGYISFSPFRW